MYEEIMRMGGECLGNIERENAYDSDHKPL